MIRYLFLFISLCCINSLCFGIYDGHEDASQNFKVVHKLKTFQNGAFVGPCTATIISDYSILTAAHCLDTNGENSIKELSISKHKYKVQKIHIPNSYRKTSNTYYKLIRHLNELNSRSITSSWSNQDNEDWYHTQQLLQEAHIGLARSDIAIIITKRKISIELKRVKLNFDLHMEGIRVNAVGYGWLKSRHIKKTHPQIPHFILEVLKNENDGTLGINSQTSIGSITTPGDSGGPLLLDSSHEQIGVLRGEVNYLFVQPFNIHTFKHS